LATQKRGRDRVINYDAADLGRIVEIFGPESSGMREALRQVKPTERDASPRSSP